MGVIVLRALHIGLGAFWAGALIFVAVFLEPSVREAGPDGAKVMRGLQARRFMTIMPVVALLTILTGLDLYRRISGGFQAAWITSSVGMSYTIGAVSAIVAFATGVGVLRPAAMRAAGLGARLAEAPEGERAGIQQEMQRFQGRMRMAGRVVAVLLAVALVTMAVARYM